VAVVVGAEVVGGEEVVEGAVLEGAAAGLASPPQPASSKDTASGTARRAARFLFTQALCPI